MGNEKSVLRKIRAGQLHGAALTGGALAEIFRDVWVCSLPFTLRSYAEVDYVRGKMDAAMLEGLRKGGFVSFGLTDNGFAYLMSNHPVVRPEDLAGHKVWSPEGDPISQAAFGAVGVSPVTLPLTDVLTGLQTGLVDTVASSTIGAIALQWHTRVTHLADLPLLYLTGSLVIDQKAFGQLSAADQQVVSEVLKSATAKLNRQNRADSDAALRTLRQQGIRFTTGSPDDQRQWERAVASAMDRLAAQGVFSAEMLRTLRRHIDAYRGP
jgi:TRAP-type C4-dicarboxylate transport system substrate-binding protein